MLAVITYTEGSGKPVASQYSNSKLLLGNVESGRVKWSNGRVRLSEVEPW